jgi:hypothetical protein
LLLLLLLERLPRSFELEERRKCNKSEDACWGEEWWGKEDWSNNEVRSNRTTVPLQRRRTTTKKRESKSQ